MARLRAPHFRGTLFCLVAGVAFSVSPILIQIAYDHGAAVTGVLAWRYLAAAVLLVETNKEADLASAHELALRAAELGDDRGLRVAAEVHAALGAGS